MALNARQQLFVAEYLRDLNATQAAIRAGYGVQEASSRGYELVRNNEVQVQIAAAAAERVKTCEVHADLVLRELLALATVDLAAAFDEDGSLKRIHDIPPQVRKAIAGVDVFEEFEGKGPDRRLIGHTRKLKFWDRTKALEMLGRYLALFKDKLDLTVSGDLVERISRARRDGAPPPATSDEQHADLVH